MRHLKIIALALGLALATNASAQAMSDALENSIGDAILRGQTFTAPRICVELCTVTTTDAGACTPPTGGSYARVDMGAAGLTIFKGTHGTTTGASSGTGGAFLNAAAVTFPAPTGNWGVVTGFQLLRYDTSCAAATEVLFHGALTASKTINNGDAAPSFAIDALSITLSMYDPLRILKLAAANAPMVLRRAG